MATARDSIEMKLKLARAREFQRGVNRSARSIDNLGDQAAQAARKMRGLNRSTTRTRVNLGPFSTSMRGATVAVGGLLMGIQSLVPATIALAEGFAVAGAGAGGAGAVGLSAFAQASGVARLALGDFTDALGGNEEAIKRLSPEAHDLLFTLNRARDGLRVTANQSMFPGLLEGTTQAMKNLPVINRIVAETGSVLGGLATQAGGMLGSQAWGRDVGAIGTRNARIIDNLGVAGLNLADAVRHILVEAGPLAEWLSKMALRASELTKEWFAQQRASGGLARFFREAKTNIQTIFSITGNLAGGILNLFGHDDVDGTGTLKRIQEITQTFEDWTKRIQGKDLGAELVKQIQNGLGALATWFGEHLGHAVALAVKTGWEAFVAADPIGKYLIAVFAFSKWKKYLGWTGKLQSLILGDGKKGGLTERGSTMANPLYVWVVNQTGVPGKPGTPTPVPGKKPSRIPRILRRGARIGSKVVRGAGPVGALVAAAEIAENKNMLTKRLPLPGGAGGNYSWGDKRGKQTAGRGGMSEDYGSAVEANRARRGRAAMSDERATVIENHVVLNMQDGPVYKSTSRSVARKQARRKARAG